MRTVETAPIDTLDASNASPAPDWTLVPFDVSCARCGHDLHGRTEPKCPTCLLEFEWREAVPIEELTCVHCGYHLYGLTSPRCPECGQGFEWAEALARYHRKRLPYFEYRWRDRTLKSLVGTCRRAMLPGRLWGRLNLHDPPNIVALVGMVLMCIVATHAAIAAAAILVHAALTIDYVLYPPAWARIGPGFYADEFAMFVEEAVNTFWNFALWTGTQLVAAWLAASLVALLIFQQSMRRSRVRVSQVVRVWAYATPLALPVLLFITFSLAGILDWTSNLRSSETEQIILIGMIAAWMHVLLSLRCAYARYLRMPHATAVAVASQVIALMAAIAVTDTATNATISSFIVYTLGHWLRAW